MISFSKKAKKYLDLLPSRTALNIINKIEKISIGDIRVFKIDKCGDVYKK